jgi:hypothetical protein
MLTILHPEILPHIAQLPAGLSPLTVDGVEGIILVIKGSKETIRRRGTRRRLGRLAD